jgi:hypothetical protein
MRCGAYAAAAERPSGQAVRTVSNLGVGLRRASDRRPSARLGTTAATRSRPSFSRDRDAPLSAPGRDASVLEASDTVSHTSSAVPGCRSHELTR